MFGELDRANAKDNTTIPGARGFISPIPRRNFNFNNSKLNNLALRGSRQNISKRVSPGPNKPPRTPSSFRTP